MPDLSDRLLGWWRRSGRKGLPWQHEPTPYRVWISEIMLQQTQVTTVIPYYLRFLNSFPDVVTLADADLDDVLHHWSGLGYYARARNLHKAAEIIRDEYEGRFPELFDDVVALPGIGRSTAGAILALSRNERHAILDGNVKRVLARYHAVEGWPGKTAVSKKLWRYAEANTPQTDIAEYTQAIMDFGATVCTRSNPDCGACPVAGDCEAHTLGRETDFPGRRAKKAKPLKKTQMILVYTGDAVYLEQRPASGIWGGLWSLPEIGADDDAESWCSERLDAAAFAMERWDTVRHSFTHFDLDIEPVALRVREVPHTVADAGIGLWYEFDSEQQLGLAAPVSALLGRLKEDAGCHG